MSGIDGAQADDVSKTREASPSRREELWARQRSKVAARELEELLGPVVGVELLGLVDRAVVSPERAWRRVALVEPGNPIVRVPDVEARGIAEANRVWWQEIERAGVLVDGYMFVSISLPSSFLSSWARVRVSARPSVGELAATPGEPWLVACSPTFSAIVAITSHEYEFWIERIDPVSAAGG